MMDFVRRLFSMYTLMVLVGYTLLILIGWLAAIVILKIQRDQIDLTYVLSENDGGASMSRFQLMIFTFVISLSFFLVIVGNGENPPRFPEATSGTLEAGLPAPIPRCRLKVQGGRAVGQRAGGDVVESP